MTYVANVWAWCASGMRDVTGYPRHLEDGYVRATDYRRVVARCRELEDLVASANRIRERKDQAACPHGGYDYPLL